MLAVSDVAGIPLRASSRLSYKQPFLCAPEVGAGRPTEANRADRILIVEDDLLIATEMEEALTDAGFEITGIFTTGDEAIESAYVQAPDLAVVDIRLAGGRDGVNTALELFRSYGVRCIFASAYSDAQARRRAEPAAPLGWLNKPYTMTSLTTLARAALDQIRGKSRE
jgi:DNA-binding response OmpR family regulator